MRSSSHTFASDPRSSEELLAILRRDAKCEGAGREALAILRFRGTVKELEIGRKLVQSEDPKERAIGADLLGQLGWQDRTFLEESVDALIALLSDNDPQVVYSAAVGLGHRHDARAITPLLPLAEHPDAMIRLGAVLGVSGHDDERATATLIRLSQDLDDDTRNWAMFGLGSQTDIDSPAIREALLNGVDDPIPEIRGEALIGLASRGDQRVIEPILRKLTGEFHGMWPVEAAELIRSRELVEVLKAQKSRLSRNEPVCFLEDFDRAIARCENPVAE